MASSSQLFASPFDPREWRTSAKHKRFESERSHFNFESLCFQVRSDDGIRSDSDSQALTLQSSTTAGDTPSSGHFTSSDFTEQLALEPSQRFASEARTSLREARAGLQHSAGQRRSTNTNTSINKVSSSNKSSRTIEDFDLNKLATCNHLVGRDDELVRLQQLYQDPMIKMTSVVAPSGCGKSVLASESVAMQKSSQKRKNVTVLVGTGKFDIQNRADPYQAIVQALAELIQQISESSNRFLLAELREVVQTTLGEETEILLELVPSVKTLLKKTKWKDKNDANAALDPPLDAADTPRPSTVSHKTDRSITERAARIQNVLVEFLRLIGTESHPVTMLLDDIQWAGPASLHLMDALLSDLDLKHFYLLTTCRQEYLPDLNNNSNTNGHKQQDLNNDDDATKKVKEEVKINQPLLDLLSKHSDSMDRMVLEGLNVESVQALINTLLRMDDATRTFRLAEIVHQKTDGNPFFVLQFMNILVDEDLLTYEMGTLSWQWLEGDIQSQNVANNVAEAVYKRLQTLPLHDLMILQVASCVGKTFERPMLHFVLEGLQSVFQSEWRDIDWPYAVENLDTSLKTLLTMGVIESQYGGLQKYDFAHDQIQAAANRSIPEDRKVSLRVTIGRRLIEGLNSFHRDQHLFTAVQLCDAGAQEMSSKDRSHFAFWAFLAGDTALKQGAFDSALAFCDQAIACLGDNAFEKDAELALPLFCGAAEAAYCIGSDNVNSYIDKVQSQTSIPQSQKIRVSLVQLKVLSGKRDFQGCSMAFRKTVKDLGAAKFAKKPSTLAALYQLIKTSKLLKKYNQKKLVALTECKDPAIECALSAEATSIFPLILSNPNLYIMASCKAVQWSIEYGHTKDTPAAMACYAGLIVAVFGDNEKALEIGEAALALCDEHGYKAALPKTVGFVFGFIRHWSRPMHEFATPMRYAIDIGTRLGCMDDCAFLMNTYGLLLVLTSTHTLKESIKEIQGFRHTMNEMNHKDHLSFTECNLQFAHKLAFPHDDNFSLDGDIMNEESMRQLAKDNKDVVLTGFVNYYKMMLNVYFGQPIQAADLGEAVIGMGSSYAQGAHLVSRCTFFIGLSNVLAYKVDGKARRIRTAKAMKKRLMNWVKQLNPNVLHFLQLLQGELHSLKKNWKQAKIEFTSAINSSSRTGFKLDFALGNELLSIFYANPKNDFFDRDQAQFHMEQAIESYQAYGAANKVSHLKHSFAKMQEKH